MRVSTRPTSRDLTRRRLRAESNVIWAVLGVIGLPAAAFVSAPLLARGLSVSERGRFASFIAVATLVGVLTKFGVDDAVLVSVGRLHAIPRDFVRRCQRLLLLLGILGSLIGCALLRLVGAGDTAWVVLLIPLTQISIPARAALLAMTKLRPLTLETWAQALLRLGSFAVLALFGALTDTSAVAAHMLSLVVAGTIVLAAANRIPSVPTAMHDHQLGSFAANSLAASLTGVVMLRLDQLVIAPLAGAHELGLYAGAVALAEVPLLLTGGIKAILQGQVARSGTPAPVLRALGVVAFLGLAGIPIAYFLSGSILRVLYGDKYGPAAGMLFVLLVACIPAALTDLASNASVALGDPGARTKAVTASAVVTLLLLAPFVTWRGGLGAALCSLIAYSTAALVSIVLLLRMPGTRDAGVVA